jgi:hypothetical protein
VCERKALLQGAMDIGVCRNFYSSPVTPARPQLKCRGGCLGAEMAIKVLVRWDTVATMYGNRVMRASGARDTERASLRLCWSVPRPRTIPRRVQKRSVRSLATPAGLSASIGPFSCLDQAHTRTALPPALLFSDARNAGGMS